MEYNSKYTGAYYQLKGGEVYTQTSAGIFKYAGASTGGVVIMQLTGYYTQSLAGNTMYQTTTGGWINMADGWQYQAYAPIRMYSAKDAQYYVDGIIKNNAYILENNLFCARFASKLTEDEQFVLRGLQMRLEGRNNNLLNDGLCDDQKVSYPPGYANLNVYLAQFMDGVYGIGSATATIVVAAIVIASLATAAYFAYKAMYNESEDDVKYSKDLTKILMERLTEEEYQQLMQETQGIVTKAKLKSKLSNTLSIAKWGLVALGGFFIYKSIKDKKGGLL